MYTHIHTHARIHIYTYTLTQIYTFMCSCMHAHLWLTSELYHVARRAPPSQKRDARRRKDAQARAREDVAKVNANYSAEGEADGDGGNGNKDCCDSRTRRCRAGPAGEFAEALGAVRVSLLSGTKTVPVIMQSVSHETSSRFYPLPSHDISPMSYHARQGAAEFRGKITQLLRLHQHVET